MGNSNTSTSSDHHAFLWTPAFGMEDLGTLPGATRSSPFGINNFDVVVGASNASAGSFLLDNAFLWTREDGMLDLNDLVGESAVGWHLREARQINDGGQIVGWGFDPAHNQRAFLLTPVPEPSTLVLAAIAAVIFAGHRVRPLAKRT